MTDMRRFGFLDLLMLLVVFTAAAGARAGYLAQFADTGKSPGPLRVQAASPRMPGFVAPEGMRGGDKATEQDALISNVKHGFWFASKAPLSDGEETTAHVAPGFPYLVGLLSRQVADDSQVDYYVRWGQVGLGALTAAFYYLFARRAFRSLAAGTVAGLFTALHPFWIVEVANVNDSTLAGAALAFALLLASQAGEKGGALKSLLLGASLAGLALVRAEYLPFSFVMLVWFLLRSKSLKLGWLCALCAFLGFGAALSPWTIRNYQEFNEPVPVVSSTYLHLWVGNNPKATGGPATTDVWDSAPKPKAGEGQPARYAGLGQEVVKEMRDNPVGTVQRRLWAALYFYFGQRWFTDGVVAEQTSQEDGVPAPLANNALVLNSVLLGMGVLTFLGWRWSYGWRWESVPAALAMMWVPLPYIVAHAGALSGARLPLDGVMLCFSAFALCSFLPGVGGHLRGGAENAATTPADQA